MGVWPIPRHENPVESVEPTAQHWRSVSRLPYWSHDGRALTYVDTRKGVSNIWSHPWITGKPEVGLARSLVEVGAHRQLERMTGKSLRKSPAVRLLTSTSCGDISRFWTARRARSPV
jgi:hypothetical protein